MGTQNSTQYPFICENAGERGGLLENPAVDPALFTAPTATFTSLMTAGSVGVGFIPNGHFKVKFNAVVYRVPLGTNA